MMMKSIFIKFKYSENYCLNLLLENGKLKSKVLTTLIKIMKSKNIELTDINFDKHKGNWVYSCKQIENTEVDGYRKKIL